MLWTLLPDKFSLSLSLSLPPPHSLPLSVSLSLSLLYPPPRMAIPHPTVTSSVEPCNFASGFSASSFLNR